MARRQTNGPDGQLEALPEAELQKLEAQLRPHQNEDTDYARLLRWRLLPPEEQPVDPYGTITQKQAADLIIRPDMNEYEALHAYDLDPWHPLVDLALAGFEKDPVRADFLRRYSLDRLPDDPKLRERAVAANAKAMTNLGWLYENGRGVAQDYGKACEWYQKAADAGNAYAMKAWAGCMLTARASPRITQGPRVVPEGRRRRQCGRHDQLGLAVR